MAGRARVFSLTQWPMALACAYLRAALAVARATAAEHAWTIYATCVGVINVEAVHSWWNLGASRPAAMSNLSPECAILRKNFKAEG